jgi:hypothetical protein
MKRPFTTWYQEPVLLALVGAGWPLGLSTIMGQPLPWKTAVWASMGLAAVGAALSGLSKLSRRMAHK